MLCRDPALKGVNLSRLSPEKSTGFCSHGNARGTEPRRYDICLCGRLAVCALPAVFMRWYYYCGTWQLLGGRWTAFSPDCLGPGYSSCTAVNLL